MKKKAKKNLNPRDAKNDWRASSGESSWRRGRDIEQLEELTSPDSADWSHFTQEQRQEYVAYLQEQFFSILKHFTYEASACTERLRAHADQFEKGKRRLIITTGALAILNALNAAAAAHSGEPDDPVTCVLDWLAVALPICAAILAGFIHVLTNLDSFSQYGERAKSFHECRELYLDSQKEFESLWHCYVTAFPADSEAACRNAKLLYREVVSELKFVRRQVQQVAKLFPEDPGSKA